MSDFFIVLAEDVLLEEKVILFFVSDRLACTSDISFVVAQSELSVFFLKSLGISGKSGARPSLV